MPIRKAYGRKRQPTRAARKYKRKATPSRFTPMFKKKVMAVVRRAAERKMKVFNIDGGGPIAGSGLSPGAVYNTILSGMALAQGVEQEQRVGNTVTNCKLIIRGCITTQGYDATSNNTLAPFEVHMVVFKNKKDPINNSVGQLKQLPGNMTGNVDGTLINTMYPYNRDLYKIQAVRKFNMSVNLQANEFSGSSLANNQGWGKTLHRFVVDCGISKTLKYQDNTNTPTNDWVGVAFYNVNVDGTINVSSQVRAVVVVDGVFTYNDM